MKDVYYKDIAVNFEQHIAATEQNLYAGIII
jgi:hypothetical protein